VSWLGTVLDVIAVARATSEPLDRLLARMVRASSLTRGERDRVANALFVWARWQPDSTDVVDGVVRTRLGRYPSARLRDEASVALALRWDGAASLPPATDPLVDAVLATPGPTSSSRSSWLLSLLSSRFGEGLIASLRKRAPVGLAVDARFLDVKDAISALAAIGVRAFPSTLVPSAIRIPRDESHLERPLGGVPLHRLPDAVREHVWPMDEASQLVVHALAARPGERVLDLCAGGGGKARMLAATGASLAIADKNPRRLRAAVRRIRDPVSAVVADGRDPPFRRRSFDKVLVDAPCTGTGTLRRAPDIGLRLTPDDVEMRAEVQRSLLTSAMGLAHSGGLVIYATCSLLGAENEDVVSTVLASLGDAERAPLLGLHELAPRLGIVGNETEITLLPSVHGCDGMYIAALRPRAAREGPPAR
jgi:16S rRNA (cytosine967-C5)-methyltransferase